VRPAVNLRFFFAALIVLGLTGCVSHRAKPAAPAPSYADTMKQARALFNAHDTAGAKDLYKKAADLNPARAEPWYQLSRINFNEQNYGRAIIGAEEALKRDPSQTDAQSILTIAGLRVAIEALGRLHEDTKLEGPAHNEAEKLASKMREVLGQDVLVPPQESTRHKRRTRRSRPVTRTRVADKATSKPDTSNEKSSAPSSSNPFQSLSGSGN